MKAAAWLSQGEVNAHLPGFRLVKIDIESDPMYCEASYNHCQKL